MAGTSLQPVDNVRNMMTPTAIHITATTARKPALDGRRPTATGLSSGIGPPGSAGRPVPASPGPGARRHRRPGGGAGEAPALARVTRPLEPGLRETGGHHRAQR